MSRNLNLKDYGIDEEINPKLKFNSLISVTISTLMCLAAKCPLPKPNVETTKLFLRTITDDKGEAPKNIKGFLTLLNHYSGPYEADTKNQKCFEEPPVEKLTIKERRTSRETLEVSRTLEFVKEVSPTPDTPHFVKRNGKICVKKSQKETHKKGSKHMISRISVSKSTISNKT